jgi:acylphosphatase
LAGRWWRPTNCTVQRVRVSYFGRVQGVGFRATATSIAAGFDVTGWVRNERDRSVTLEAQGEAREVEGLLVAIRERFGGNINTERVVEVGLVEGEGGFDVAF